MRNDDGDEAGGIAAGEKCATAKSAAILVLFTLAILAVQ